MKKSILIFIAALSQIGSVLWAAAPKPVAVHYEAKLSSATFGDMGVRKMWIKGDRMRYEYNCRMPLTLIKNAGGVFLVHPWQKMVAKYPKQWDRGNPNRYLPGPNGPVKEFLGAVKARKQGRETVDKQSCDVYSYTEPTTARKCRLWIGVKSGKPVRLVLPATGRKADTITARYVKFELGGQIRDSLFELPKGYAIKPMPAQRISEADGAKRGDRKSG